MNFSLTPDVYAAYLTVSLTAGVDLPVEIHMVTKFSDDDGKYSQVRNAILLSKIGFKESRSLAALYCALMQSAKVKHPPRNSLLIEPQGLVPEAEKLQDTAQTIGYPAIL